MINLKKLNLELLKNNIEKIADYDFSNKKVFGSAYYVYQESNLAFSKCYGSISPDFEKKITDTTLFRLASMTKPITAVATLILVQRGLLDLDDAVSKYIPEFEGIHIIDSEGNDLGKPQNKPTIRNILSHSSGIGSVPEKTRKLTADDKKDLDASVRFFAKLGLDFEPQKSQMYSGMGAFDVLTKIIEIVSKADYLSFLKKEIFEPCNMPDTTFVPNESQMKRLVEMHTRIDGENAIAKMPDGCIFEDFPCTHYLGGAGLVSTLHDYCNFAKMLLNRGRIGNKELVKEDILSQMHTLQIPNWELEGWGLGVRVIIAEISALPLGCFGWSGAYGSHFWIDPENKIFAVFMKNSWVDGGSGNESAVNFEKAVYDSL